MRGGGCHDVRARPMFTLAWTDPHATWLWTRPDRKHHDIRSPERCTSWGTGMVKPTKPYFRCRRDFGSPGVGMISGAPVLLTARASSLSRNKPDLHPARNPIVGKAPSPLVMCTVTSRYVLG